MTNIYDFESHKKALAAGKKLDNEREHERGDINTEIEWASKELDNVHDSLDALRDEILVAESYRLELIAYLSGMEMAKKLIEGETLEDEDFWHWLDDKILDPIMEIGEQLEIAFSPDFEIKEDE
ncbi:uncharacterized protein METZ01_LOCUS411490 [marine metagenome]|uniref:Uncharacterized protein n=1 Tax=marine metagenome TaxID=408172 RepID=A0A382WI78_9ZZZZ